MTTKTGTRMEAVVIYDYAAQESNELTLKKGDIVTKIKVMEGGWWEGTTNKDGKRGFFPDNYVKVITNNISSSTSGAPLRGKKFKVNYNYIPANVDELELHVNDIVEVISEIEEGWWEGKLRNTIGVFPSNFVTEVIEAEMNPESDNDFVSQKDNKPENEEKVPFKNIVTNNGPVLPPKPKQMKEMCIAVFPYEAKHEDELTLKENDVILLLSTDLPDKGWWKGQLNGKIGVFPDNFVKLIQVEDETSSKSEKPSVVKTTNKVSDAVPKLPSYTAASLRKSVQPEDNSLSKKPIVSKKPGFTQSSSSELIKSVEKISSSPEKSDKSISSNSLTESPLAKSTPNVSNVSEPVRGKSFSMSPSINEKLNAEIQATFAAKEADSVDGALSSKSSSYSVTNEKISKTELTTNDLPVEKELNLNEIERSQVLTHPTASRAKAPKRRPPSGINFKEDDVIPVTKTVDSPKSVVTVNGIADPVRDKVKSTAWLQELKLNQAKKNSTQVNVKSGFTITGSNVSFRFQRPVSMYTSETETGSAVFYPKSNVDSEVITTNDVTSPEKSDKVVTISASEWSALNEKVTDLELRLEMQNEFFRKTIEQLKLKLAREVEQRMELRNEIDKLMDLVTQV